MSTNKQVFKEKETDLKIIIKTIKYQRSRTGLANQWQANYVTVLASNIFNSAVFLPTTAAT